MQVQPYLSFEGRAEEAIEFYKKALGAKVEMLMRFKDAPPGSCAPEAENKVMHASLRIGDSVVMASDGRATGDMKFNGISLSLTVPTDAEADKKFAALSEGGGKTCVPMSKTFFASRFGIVT